LTRTSPLGVRKIVLSGSWWKKDAGPVLAFRSGLAVALIHDARRRYRIFDPVTGRAVRFNTRLAADLEDEAYSVYRPFPSGPVTPYRLLAFWLRECRSDLALMAIMRLLTGVLGLAVPLIMGRMANFVIPAGRRPGENGLGASPRGQYEELYATRENPAPRDEPLDNGTGPARHTETGSVNGALVSLCFAGQI
jgi:hypothetical protein